MSSFDLQTLSNSNACGMCRALRLKSCRCEKGKKAGAGGGASGAGSNDSVKENAPQTRLKCSPSENISNQLSQNTHWILVDTDELAYQLNCPNSIINILIAIESCKLVFGRRRDLLAEDKKAVKDLWNAIEQEALLFNQNVIEKNIENPIKIQRTAHQLSIVSVPKYYDLFVQNLMDKHLLPMDGLLQKQRQDVKSFSSTESMDLVEIRPSAPTPFDISAF